jgi:two-component system, chemotaxis family, chemotaxis protein CheV
MSSLASNSITGVVRLEGRIIFILDLEKIVAELNPELGLHFDENVTWEAGTQYRALIADDSTLIREMIGDLLHKANFLVEKSTHGGECWERLQHIKKIAEDEGRPVTDYVQVVISDIEMPVMDGHNLTKRIKEDPVLKELPVILFSSIISDKLRHKGDAVGADDQISKPEITHVAQRAVTLIKERIAAARG